MLFIGTANSWVLTSFSQLLFLIYLLVINPTNTGVSRFKLPGGAQSGEPLRKSLPIKYHEQKFFIKSAFSGQHWTGLSMEKSKNSVLGVLVENINFSFDWNQQFMTCYSSMQFILLKIASLWNEKLAPQQQSL